MLTMLGGKQHMDRATRQYLAQIKSDARNTITVRLYHSLAYAKIFTRNFPCRTLKFASP